MVVRWPVALGVMSILKRTTNWSPFTKGPSTSTPWTSWLAFHHSPLPRAASMPRLTGSPPPGAPASTLTTSFAQYFSPDSSNLPCFQSATRSLATSCVVICLLPLRSPTLGCAHDSVLSAAACRRAHAMRRANRPEPDIRLSRIIMSDAQPASVYDLAHADEAESLATFPVLADNEPGVLHRLAALFAARGYNIESLTVADTDRKAHTSRVTIVPRGTPQVLAQIEAQLSNMVSTRHVQDVTRDPNGLERELALVKVKGAGPDRVEALRVADIFRAKVIDTTHESFVFELTGAPSKIDKFTDLMRPLGLVEVSRTGVLSIQRGVEAL